MRTREFLELCVMFVLGALLVCFGYWLGHALG